MPHPKDRKSQLRFQTQNSVMNLLKKGISKRNFYMFNSPWKFFGWPSAEKFEAEKLVVLTGDLSIISIGKVLKADLKKSFFCYKYWWASISTILVITKIYIYIYIFLFILLYYCYWWCKANLPRFCKQQHLQLHFIIVEVIRNSQFDEVNLLYICEFI